MPPTTTFNGKLVYHYSDSPVEINGWLTYQACDDPVCCLPESFPIAWTLQIGR